MHFPFFTIGITLLQVSSLILSLANSLTTVCLFQIILFAVLDASQILRLQYEHDSLLEVWRLITYMFVETDPRNLILNVPAQVLLGFLLENFHVWWKVPILYFGSGAMAALSSSYLDKAVPLVGAAPGVFSFAFSCLAEMQIVSDKDLSE